MQEMSTHSKTYSTVQTVKQGNGSVLNEQETSHTPKGMHVNSSTQTIPEKDNRYDREDQNMTLGTRQRDSKYSILLICNREVHSIKKTLHFSRIRREQELPPRLLPIFRLPFPSTTCNPHSIKAVHRIHFCFPPLINSNPSFSHSRAPKSILLRITRKKEVKCPSSLIAIGNGTFSHSACFVQLPAQLLILFPIQLTPLYHYCA